LASRPEQEAQHGIGHRAAQGMSVQAVRPQGMTASQASGLGGAQL